MNNKDLLLELQDKYPYLYDILLRVQKIQKDPGFGEISTSLHIAKGKVTVGSICDTSTMKYIIQL